MISQSHIYLVSLYFLADETASMNVAMHTKETPYTLNKFIFGFKK